MAELGLVVEETHSYKVCLGDGFKKITSRMLSRHSNDAGRFGGEREVLFV